MNTNLQAEIQQLRKYLDGLAVGSGDDPLRYELLQPPMPPGVYWKLRWLAGLVLRWLEYLHLKQPDPWPARLKKVPGTARAKPLLIWAVGTDRDTMREGCRGFLALHESLPDFAPVLVTDVADFAFFSRLRWLVEYLPKLAGEGTEYQVRKTRFLARLYRDAPALPIGACLETGRRADEIRQWILCTNHPTGRAHREPSREGL